MRMLLSLAIHLNPGNKRVSCYRLQHMMLRFKMKTQNTQSWKWTRSEDLALEALVGGLPLVKGER